MIEGRAIEGEGKAPSSRCLCRLPSGGVLNGACDSGEEKGCGGD